MSDAGGPSEVTVLPWDPPAARDGLRLTTAYATPWHVSVALGQAESPVGPLRLGRLADFYRTSDAEMPQVLAHIDLDPEVIEFRRWSRPVRAAHCWFFVLPSGQVVAALTLDFSAGAVDSIPLLEDLYYADVRVGDTPFEEWCHLRVAEQKGCDVDGGSKFVPERHQILFAGEPKSSPALSHDQLQRVIYRADLPARQESIAIRKPDELNRRPTTVAALGPYVSVLAGQQDYVENAALLSAVQIVGTAARLREIRQRAYECVRAFRAHQDQESPVQERRLTFEDIADLLGELELELSFSVEATADIGLLIPSLRVESYHDALYESMNLARRAETTSHMLDRLRNAIDAELTSVTSAEERAEAARRLRTVVAVTFVTTIGGTLAVLFSFFGINAAEVDERISMFDPRYAAIYLVILLIVAVALVLYVTVGSLEKRRLSRHRALRGPSAHGPGRAGRMALGVAEQRRASG